MCGFLYGQTEYNLLNNALKINDYVKTSSQYGYEYLSITDTNMYGYLKFYNECKKYNVKPIIGLELKVEEYSLLAYAVNMNGLKFLNNLSTLIQDKETLLLDNISKSEDIIYIVKSSSFLNKNIDEIKDDISRLNNTLNNYYVGIYYQENRNENINIYNIMKEIKINCLPLYQTRYLNREDRDVLDALMKIGGNNDNLNGDFFLPNKKELLDLFNSDEEIFFNLKNIIKNINYSFEQHKIALPVYPNTNDSKTYLKSLCFKGLEKRLSEYRKVNKDEYINRLNFELEIINKMEYNDYFLIVWDFVRYAKKSGIMVGPGRGSAAGSLVSFCLGITSIDPIRYDLLFERFLNPERISMPDIDMDFPDDRRDEVIEYVKNLYGKEHVCYISAYATFKVKSSIRDLGRILKIPLNRLDEIIKMASRTEDSEYLLEQFSDNDEIYYLLRIAKKLEGLPRHISTHAAGIILSNDSLKDLIPLQPGLNGLYQSQLEASDLESLGLLKIDFLGIRNLAIIDNIVKEIPNLNNINIYKIPLNDPKTYQLLSEADTLGIFQLESDGMKKVLLKLKPNNFEDIVAVLALYRPGPMENIDEYVARKNGKPFEYFHHDLIDILSPTYGIIIYQEQIMKIALKFAGYSLGEADLLRRAVSKKQEQVLILEREKFVSKSIEKGYSDKDANDIYDYIVKFANYGFNRSHSVAYALVSYQMAYFKANYFKIFIAKILNNVIGSQSSMAEYINYAKSKAIYVLNPSINYSTMEFRQTKRGLLFPLQGVFSVGGILSSDIIKERQNGLFKSFSDFKTRVKNINSRALESLIYAGAFDEFNETKKNLIESIDEKTEVFDKFLEDRILSLDEYDFETLKKGEVKSLGLNLKYNIFINIEKLIKYYKTNIISNIKPNTFAKIICTLEEIKEIRTKNDDLMLVGNINDGRQKMDMVIFPDYYSSIRGICQMNKLYIVEGKVGINKRNDKIQIQINKITLAQNN